jgi:hypothetical protein
MDETSLKCIMAAIVFASMDMPEDDAVCPYDIAVAIADDLYAHVVGNFDDSALPPLKPVKGQAN